MRKINKVKIYHNDNEHSKMVLSKLKKSLVENNFKIVDKRPELVIAIGGDGAFLRAIKQENYNSEIIYIGVNAGTLGFLQEIKIENIEQFIKCLNNNTYIIEEVSVQETNIYTNDNKHTFYSLNEIVIRDKDLNSAYLEIKIKDTLFEKYSGDGILISTSVGSTAYNLSFGGSIVSNSFHTLQITPIAPLNNKVYNSLMSSIIIPEQDQINILPIKNTKDLLISVDGENYVFNDVKSIDTRVDNKRIKILHSTNYNYWQKINEKLLSKL